MIYATTSHQQVIPDTVQTLTLNDASPAKPGTKGFLIQTNNALRYTIDGTDPTTTKGFRLVAADAERYVTSPILKVINEVAGGVLDYVGVGERI